MPGPDLVPGVVGDEDGGRQQAGNRPVSAAKGMVNRNVSYRHMNLGRNAYVCISRLPDCPIDLRSEMAFLETIRSEMAFLVLSTQIRYQNP